MFLVLLISSSKRQGFATDGPNGQGLLPNVEGSLGGPN
jgi:hypothetical protein